jgi:predicted acylesterase/phospholipase RssA
MNTHFFFVKIHFNKNQTYNKIKIQSIKHLVLSGGGFKGFAFVGALSELKKYKIDWGLQSPLLDSVTGCSIGSLIALLIVLGYSSAELDHIINTTDFKAYINIDYLPGSLSLDSGLRLREFIEEKIYSKCPDILTLEQLYKKRKTLLRIAVVNLQTGQSELFDAKKTPSIQIIDAIMASVALPPLFPPVEINNTLYADAGLVDYFPIQLASENIDTNTLLGLRLQANVDLSKIKSELNTSIFPLATYLKHVYDVVNIPSYELYAKNLPQHLKDRTIIIETPEANMIEAGINPLMIYKVKNAIIQAGITAIQSHLYRYSI